MTKLTSLTAAAAFILMTACAESAPETNIETSPNTIQAKAVSTAAVTTESEAPTTTSVSVSDLYANILQTYVTEENGINFFAYGKVTDAHHAELKTYIASLEAQGTEGMNDNEIKAFWFNVYNAKTIDVILDNYPLESIRSLGSFNRGPWDRKLLNVKGKGEMSLNDVEHGTLRAEYKEPRIHYAVNCASYGCPNLKATVWTAENLEADLVAAAEAYINHPRGVRVEGNKVIASKIFDWYKVDFGNNQTGMLEHFRQYAKGDLAAQLNGKTKISKFEYDWNLNER